jgi:hypothetical protein
MNKKLIPIIVVLGIIGISITIIGSGSFDSKTTVTRDKNSIVSDILQECDRDDECVYLELQKISKTEPQEVVIYVANQIPLEWEKDEQNCHVIAHHVSEFLLGYFNGNLTEAITHVGNACGNALYHGVVENYLSLKVLLEDVEIDDLDITSPCMNVGSSMDSNLHQQCVHGLGHSLATVYDFDVTKAVKRCDEFEDPVDQDRCSDGLFMENNNENFNNGGGSYDENDIFYPCNSVDEKYKFRCYFYQGYHILRLNGYSHYQSFNDCEKIPDEEKYVVRCIHAISQDMALQFFSNDHEKIIEMCNDLNPKYQWECIRISSNALTIYIDPEMGDDLCYLIQEDLKEKCLANWEKVIKQHNTV